MYALNSENQEMTALAKEVFEDSPIDKNSHFLEFLRTQKYLKDLKQSKLVSIDLAFEQVIVKL